jgi:hypothetical protein
MTAAKSVTATFTLIPLNGACGPAAKAYYYNEVFPSGTYCSSGTANPATPVNPAAGGSTSWSCTGIGGGTTASCTATRAAASPCVDTDGENAYIKGSAYNSTTSLTDICKRATQQLLCKTGGVCPVVYSIGEAVCSSGSVTTKEMYCNIGEVCGDGVCAAAA